jgi:hypothetical protein
VEARRTALSPGRRSLGSDRAKALDQRAAQGFEGLSLPDVVHGMHALVQRYAFARARRVPQAPQALKQAEEARRRHLGPTGPPQAASAAAQAMAVRRATGQRWEQAHGRSRHHLEPRSRTLPPGTLPASAPQTAAEVHHR